jgi:hypothetical protein
MSVLPQASRELLAILARKAAPDPQIVAGYLSGDIRTAPAMHATLRQPSHWKRFLPRRRPCSPDRKAARERRRMLGGSGVMPHHLRACYTEGERAVLCVIAGEVKHHGICDLAIDNIARRAGVCRTTVQTAMHEARRLGHLKITERPQRGHKSLTNVLEIISPEWRAWIKRGPIATRDIGSNLESPYKNIDSKLRAFQQYERPQATFQRAHDPNLARTSGQIPPGKVAA